MLTELFAAPTITESGTDPASPDLASIRGRFLSEGAKSSNRRQYVNIAPWIAKAQERIDAGAVIDIRTCHEAGDKATEIVGKITKLHPDGTYEGRIANTPTGQAVLPLIKGGYLKHVSLRANRATAEPLEGQDGWVKITDVEGLAGIDFTNNPGIGEASVAVAESARAEHVIESFEIGEREYNTDERKAAAKSGAAMPDGSFPINTLADLENAVHLYGNSHNPAEAKAHIIKRAQALGLTDHLPLAWKDPDGDGDNDLTKSGDTDHDYAGKESAGEDSMSIADAINQAVEANTTPATTEPAPVIESTDIAGAITSAVEANKSEPAVSLDEALRVVAELSEAGKRLSGANMAHLKAAHDHLAQAAKMDCAPGNDDNSQEAAPAAPVTESTDVSVLVEAAVRAALETERTRIEETIKAEREAAVQEAISQFLTAKRKTSGITESDEAGEGEKLTLGQALHRYMQGSGVTR